jgi:microcystin-dependent protein
MSISLEADPTLPQGYIKINGTTAATLDATGITTGGVPAGAVMPFAMNSAPTGWLAADGTEYSKTGIYAALFAAIQTTYGETNGAGAAGTTHFRVPDLRGYFVRGAGANSDTTAAGTFGAKQADSVISHTHSGTTAEDYPDHAHWYGNYPPNRRANPVTGPATMGDGLAGNWTGGASTRHQHDFTTASQSPAGATETRPANIALLYCIKA